ncbi:MAG: helix-turn-helix domain-containing protein [Rhodospirillales bacterium]|nr:helix-turn-helix domain-containing protein [Rhodospirillales bacterium]
MKTKKPSSRGRCPDGKPNLIDIHVGSRVRLRRTLLGISQEKLGEAIGLTFQQVQKYERGTNRIGASRLFDLARVLDVPVSFFYDNMTDKVREASPALIKAGAVPASVPASEDDVFVRRETMELVRAYYRLQNPAARQVVLKLIRTMVQDVGTVAC